MLVVPAAKTRSSMDISKILNQGHPCMLLVRTSHACRTKKELLTHSITLFNQNRQPKPVIVLVEKFKHVFVLFCETIELGYYHSLCRCLGIPSRKYSNEPLVCGSKQMLMEYFVCMVNELEANLTSSFFKQTNLVHISHRDA